ncbi:MAG TPA: EAL domain-containing protein, partial [Thermoanaerobaculia bacterium]
IYGTEALLRWRRSDGRIAGPADFIRTLETSGLIVPVGDWVLRRACMDAASWQSAAGRRLDLSVNLGARQFQRPDLAERVAGIIEETGFDAERLQLEITENCAMQNIENSVRMLRELKRLGVRIALDDFGTGYSSLNYLRRFPIDTLKLDRSFVLDVNEDENDAAIATAMISMAHSLGLTVIAEGIEKEDQLAFLRALGCRRGQGFLFGPPMSVEEFIECIDNGLPAASAPDILVQTAL